DVVHERAGAVARGARPLAVARVEADRAAVLRAAEERAVEERHRAGLVAAIGIVLEPERQIVFEITRQIGDVEASDGAETVARSRGGDLQVEGPDDEPVARGDGPPHHVDLTQALRADGEV